MNTERHAITALAIALFVFGAALGMHNFAAQTLGQIIGLMFANLACIGSMVALYFSADR